MASSILLISVAGTAADRIERLLQARGFDVTASGDPSRAAEQAPRHQLLVVEAADTARLVALISQLRQQVGERLPMLAIAHGNDVEEQVALLEAGADDVLGQPIGERELDALVEALLLRSVGLDRQEQVPAHLAVRAARGQIFVFAASKGGSGTTTLAVNTAVALALRPELDVAIVDLDLYRGQVAVHLDVRGDVSTAGLARDESAGRPEQIAAAGQRHSTGLNVYPAPHRPDEATQVTAPQLRRLVDDIRGIHPIVVVDAGTVLDARALTLLEMADRVVIAVTPEIPALRALHGLLEVLADGSTVSERTLFVLNNLYAKPMLDQDQIEENLGVKFALRVPYHDQLFVKAVNEGQPVVVAAPRSAQAQQLKNLAGMLISGEEEGDEAVAGGRLLGRLRRRG